MKNIKIIIEYDGTNYSGWQRQLNQDTIQGEIEKAIFKLTGENVNLIGSGRTDAGVHALGQTANFITDVNIPPDKIKFGLNAFLPHDIRISDSEEVSLDFHSRYNVKRKIYKYLIYNRAVKNPFWGRYSYYFPQRLNYELMEREIKYFLGAHDFTSFSSPKSSSKDKNRIIYNALLLKDGDLVMAIFDGNGFLYNMVRIMIGTLVDIGRGKIAEGQIPFIMESLDRQRAGHTAPPQGLFLEKVFYE